jgi:hypothetical protein
MNFNKTKFEIEDIFGDLIKLIPEKDYKNIKFYSEKDLQYLFDELYIKENKIKYLESELKIHIDYKEKILQEETKKREIENDFENSMKNWIDHNYEKVRLEIFNEKGELHRIHGPAVVELSLPRDGSHWHDKRPITENHKFYNTIKTITEYTNNFKDFNYNFSQYCSKIHVEWYLNGKLHRIDGPAIESKSHCSMTGYYGYYEYYINGKLHRTDGPAIYRPSKSVSIIKYYIYGKLHRTDGPASNIFGCGERTEEWYKNGKLHRIDGPAIKKTRQEEYFYINNEPIGYRSLVNSNYISNWKDNRFEQFFGREDFYPWFGER